MRLALLLALTVSTARAEGIRGGINGGLGVGRGLFGAQIELGAGSWTGFAGLSPDPIHLFALGARWSTNPDGSGFGVAVQTALWRTHGDPNFAYSNDRETETFIAATAHWRWRWGFLMVDIGAGPAITFDSYRYATYADSPNAADNGSLVRTTCFGIPLDAGRSCAQSIPLDLEVGAGFAF